MIKIEVNYFKESGKWYTSETIENVMIPVWDNSEIIQYIKNDSPNKHLATEMDFTYEATDNDGGGTNHRLVKLQSDINGKHE